MIPKQKAKQLDKDVETFDSQFKKLINEIIGEEYVKKSDVKEIINTILDLLEPRIAEHVKTHINEIGKFAVAITSNPKDTINGDNENAKTS